MGRRRPHRLPCTPPRPTPLRVAPAPHPACCSFEKYGGLSASLRTLLDAPPEVDMDEYQQRSRVQVGGSVGGRAGGRVGGGCSPGCAALSWIFWRDSRELPRVLRWGATL